MLSEARGREKGQLYLKTRGEHASCDYEIGDDEAGHAEGQENGLAGV